MSAWLAVLVLTLTATVLFVLPLIPGLRELYFSSDAQPLTVVQQHAGEIRYFANSFRNYISVLNEPLERCAHAGGAIRGVLPDGVQYLITGENDSSLLETTRQSNCPYLIAATVDLLVPGETTFSHDIYARRNFAGGKGNRYRAILGEQDIELGSSSTVARWVHAVGKLHAQENCDLHGRTSSDLSIRLHRGCAFQRLNAPCIELGEVNAQLLLPVPGTETPAEAVPQRFLHEGDYEIAAGAVLVGNLCVRGDLVIRRGARVLGSVKSGARLTVEPSASIAGGLVSMQEMHIGKGSSVHGPIIAERRLVIEEQSRCGEISRPTTVTASHIEVAEGTVIFGSLWAREFGVVVAR